MAPKADEKYIKRPKNTLLAECMSFLKICVQFDKYKRDMLCFRSSSQFSLCLQLVSSTCINDKTTEKQDKRLRIALKCHLDEFLSSLVDLYELNR